jgi:hypothetical protein
MSIFLQFYNVLIPIKILEEKVAPIEEIMKWKDKERNGYKPFHDKHLYHEGAMGPDGIERIVDFWQEKGINPFVIKNGKEYWDEMCMVDSFGGVSAPCDWIEVGPYNENLIFHAWLKDKDKGNIYGYPLKS